MRTPATIAPWMEVDELERWARDAPTKALHERRLAIWWTARDRRHATEIAELLGVGSRTVRRWIRSFNTEGPAGLETDNLGGRRWAHLSEAEERATLADLRAHAEAGRLVTIHEVRASVEARVGHAISSGSLYALLHRHEWRKVVPRPRHVGADPDAQEAYPRGPSPPLWRG